MNEADKRVIRTKAALKAALVSLIQEKPLTALTIQELTKEAGVGYRTFFRHYADKDELLLDLLQSTIQDLENLMPFRLPEAGVTSSDLLLPVENGRLLFTHVQQNSDLYRVLLAGDNVALGTVLAFARQEAVQYLPETLDGVPREIVANHLVTAVLSLIQWWLENGMPYSTAEMGAYASRLVGGTGA